METQELRRVRRNVQVTAMVLDPRSRRFRLRFPRQAALLEILQTGAERASVQLLPSPEEPFDLLRNFVRRREVGPPIVDLTEEVGAYLDRPETTRHFGIELVRAFRVNTRWEVAPQPALTPREILALPRIGLDYTQYTLYLPGSNELLPLDTPVAIVRGQAFEAQRDGRYGGRL